MSSQSTASATRTRIALVTGGNRGLGKSTVLALAARGVTSIFTYRSHSEEADEVVSAVSALNTGARAVALQLDTADVSSLDPFVKTFTDALNQLGSKNFDYLVNMAGYAALFRISDTTEALEAEIDKMYTVAFKSVWLLTSKLLPLLRDNEGSAIINITTGLTRFTNSDYAAYASMKGAIEVWTRYLAKEVGPRGIRAVAVAPGVVATDFGGGAARDNKGGAREMMGKMTALGRIGEAEDIGPAVAALLGNEFGWLNGTRVELSGGQQI